MTVRDDETVVRSTCPSCGTVDLPADAVTVFITADGEPRYRYACPQCYATVDKPTTAQAITLLEDAGAHVVLVPAEAAEGTPATRDFDDDDLIAFARALAATDDIAGLAGAW